MIGNRWYKVAICVLLLFWLQAAWRWWQLHSEIERIYVNEVTIKAMDARTSEPLQMLLHSPGRRMGQRWPVEFSCTTTGDVSEMRVRWIDIGPIEVGVSAEGYPEQRLRLDRNTEKRMVVRLHPQAP